MNAGGVEFVWDGHLVWTWNPHLPALTLCEDTRIEMLIQGLMSRVSGKLMMSYASEVSRIAPPQASTCTTCSC